MILRMAVKRVAIARLTRPVNRRRERSERLAKAGGEAGRFAPARQQPKASAGVPWKRRRLPESVRARRYPKKRHRSQPGGLHHGLVAQIPSQRSASRHRHSVNVLREGRKRYPTRRAQPPCNPLATPCYLLDHPPSCIVQSRRQMPVRCEGGPWCGRTRAWSLLLLRSYWRQDVESRRFQPVRAL